MRHRLLWCSKANKGKGCGRRCTQLTGSLGHLAEGQEAASPWGRTTSWHWEDFFPSHSWALAQRTRDWVLGWTPLIPASTLQAPPLTSPCPLLPPSFLWFKVSAPTPRGDCRGLTHWGPSSRHASLGPSHFQFPVLFLWPKCTSCTDPDLVQSCWFLPPALGEY